MTARRSPDWRSTPKRSVDRVKQVTVPFAPLRSARPTSPCSHTAQPISSARGDHSARTCVPVRAPQRAPPPRAPVHEYIGGLVASGFIYFTVWGYVESELNPVQGYLRFALPGFESGPNSIEVFARHPLMLHEECEEVYQRRRVANL